MKDCIGQDIIDGDYVAGLKPDEWCPDIFVVTGFTPKKVRVKHFSNSLAPSLKFPLDILKLTQNQIDTMLAQVPTDRLGETLVVGDYCYGSGGTYIEPVLYEILGFTNGKADLARIGETTRRHERICANLIRVPGRLITMKLLSGV